MSALTPKYNIPYLTAGDRMTEIPVVDKKQAERLESLLETANVPPGNPDLNAVLTRLNNLEADALDTGWVDCPLNGGVQQGAGLPQVRRKGKFVQMRWGVSGSNLSVNGSKVVCNVPDGFRPTEYKYFVISSNTIANLGTCNVRTNGDVEVRVGSSVGSYYIFDSCSWYID